MENLSPIVYGTLISTCAVIMAIYAIPDIYKSGGVAQVVIICCMFFATFYFGFKMAYKGFFEIITTVFFK